VVDHFLLSSERSPLRVFSPDGVLKMTAEQLDIIAGEDAVSRARREMLRRNIAILEEGKKLFRG